MCGHKLQPIFFRRRRRIATHGNETLALLPASRCVFVHSDDGDDNLEAVVVGRERLPARTSPPKTARSHSIPKMLFPRSNKTDERTNDRTDHSLGSEEKSKRRTPTMLDMVVRRFHLRLRPSKVDGRGPEGGLWTTDSRMLRRNFD